MDASNFQSKKNALLSHCSKLHWTRPIISEPGNAPISHNAFRIVQTFVLGSQSSNILYIPCICALNHNSLTWKHLLDRRGVEFLLCVRFHTLYYIYIYNYLEGREKFSNFAVAIQDIEQKSVSLMFVGKVIQPIPNRLGLLFSNSRAKLYIFIYICKQNWKKLTI